MVYAGLWRKGWLIMVTGSKDKSLAAIVCGFERGGTTLLTEILRRHPKINGGFEGGFLLKDRPKHFLEFEPYRTIVLKGWNLEETALKYICDTEKWDTVYTRLAEASPLINEKNEQIFDKTPRYMENLSKVLLKIPEVPCIAIVRDPRAIIASWYRRTSIHMDEWRRKNLKPACRRYCIYARGLFSAMKEPSFSSRILVIRYEELCLRPADVLTKVFEFIGQDFDEAYAQFPDTPAFPNVHGGAVSSHYIHQYRQTFDENTLRQILVYTDRFPQLHWD